MSNLNFFHTLSEPNNILPHNKLSTKTVADTWYQFSNAMPEVLIKLALKSKSPAVKSKLIAICNEELGDGDQRSIHSELFENSCKLSGIDINKDTKVESLTLLRDLVNRSSSDPEILGIHLGLEIIANENIKKLAETIATQPAVIESPFFKIHLMNEDEHIESCINNFTIFCKTNEERNQFEIGFRKGLLFWKSFWDEVKKQDEKE